VHKLTWRDRNLPNICVGGQIELKEVPEMEKVLVLQQQGKWVISVVNEEDDEILFLTSDGKFGAWHGGRNSGGFDTWKVNLDMPQNPPDENEALKLLMKAHSAISSGNALRIKYCPYCQPID